MGPVIPSPILPVWVIFGFGNTLLPYNISNIRLPLTKLQNGKIIDDNGLISINHYPEVPEILKKLKNAGVKLTVSLKHDEKIASIELIKLFSWDQYFSYTIGRSPCSTEHFLWVRKESKIDFDDMMVFDSDAKCVEAAQKCGIFSVQVHSERGMTMKILVDALKEYQIHRRKNQVRTEPQVYSEAEMLLNPSILATIGRFCRYVLQFFIGQ